MTLTTTQISQFEPMLAALAVEVAALVRADDGDTAGTSLGTTAMMIAATLLRDNRAAAVGSTEGFEEVNALFRAALATQRLSATRTVKVVMAFDIAMMTFNQVTLGMVVV